MRRRAWGTVLAVIAMVAVFAVGMTVILHAEARASSGTRAVAVPETTPSTGATPTSTVLVPDLTDPSSADPSSADPGSAATSTAVPRSAVAGSVARTATSPTRTTTSAAQRTTTASATRTTTATTTPSATTTSTTSTSTTSTSTTSTSSFLITKPTGEPVGSGTADQVSDAVDDAVADAADNGITEHVIVIDRTTGDVLASDNSHTAVPAMSVAKLFVAADALELDGGPDQMDADDLQRLHDMIEYSDDEIMQDYYDADGGDAIIERTVERYGLQDTTPTPEERYWGDIKISARDMASFLRQALASDVTGPFLEAAMTASADTGADGFDQDFGMNAIAGAGSKQGWGCCLGGVDAIHSVGFTANRIVVVLSASDPDKSYTKLGTASELADDDVTQAAMTAVTRTARAAVDPSG